MMSIFLGLNVLKGLGRNCFQAQFQWPVVKDTTKTTHSWRNLRPTEPLLLTPRANWQYMNQGTTEYSGNVVVECCLMQACLFNAIRYLFCPVCHWHVSIQLDKLRTSSHTYIDHKSQVCHQIKDKLIIHINVRLHTGFWHQLLFYKF